jgi:hypothetical protein
VYNRYTNHRCKKAQLKICIRCVLAHCQRRIWLEFGICFVPMLWGNGLRAYPWRVFWVLRFWQCVFNPLFFTTVHSYCGSRPRHSYSSHRPGSHWEGRYHFTTVTTLLHFFNRPNETKYKSTMSPGIHASFGRMVAVSALLAMGTEVIAWSGTSIRPLSFTFTRELISKR